jgi:glycosyltransferase involved in cell wall biosynthesis
MTGPIQLFYPSILREGKGLLRLVLPLLKELPPGKEIHYVGRDVAPGLFSSGKVSLDRVNIIPLKRVLNSTPLRWDLKMMTFLEYEIYDRLAARKIWSSGEVFALEGMALNIFQKARRYGLEKKLIATTLHIDEVWQSHQQEANRLGRDYEWLNDRLRKKILQEYDLADSIIVPSQLTRQTFISRGFPERKLRYVPPEVNRDFYHRREPKKDKTFRALYVGRLTPQKGVHYIIRAFQELRLPDSELILFGGTPTSALRRWVQSQIQEDNKIKVMRGDPRPVYEQASVLVHPSLNDNSAATVSEALAYDLPVILTEATGAKELIRPGENGFIIPCRDVAALKEKLRFYYQKFGNGL